MSDFIETFAALSKKKKVRFDLISPKVRHDPVRTIKPKKASNLKHLIFENIKFDQLQVVSQTGAKPI